MADREVEKNENEKTEKVTETTGVVARRHSQKWVIWVVAGVVALYIVIVIIGAVVFHVWANNHQNVGVTGAPGQARQLGRSRGGDRTFTERSSTSDGLTTTTTNTTYTQTQGVVTAVNSDNIVVAGGGKTQTIKTNSSTTYVGDTKPAVNDTVVIVGTKDGDTITATQIAVYN
jgi:hypothetical protein